MKLIVQANGVYIYIYIYYIYIFIFRLRNVNLLSVQYIHSLNPFCNVSLSHID